MGMQRRKLLAQGLAVGLAWCATRVRAAADTLGFREMYGKVGVLGLSFSAKTQALKGQTVSMQGFMAPPLKAEAMFFVLTEVPMALCPFCSSDADWPNNIVLVYLTERQTFVQNNAPIRVTGKLEVGSWTDPATGFVSLVRLTGAKFSSV
ncbi:hypothetical protein ACFQ95_07695 [Variovorax sp. HJSM1_2]